MSLWNSLSMINNISKKKKRNYSRNVSFLHLIPFLFNVFHFPLNIRKFIILKVGSRNGRLSSNIGRCKNSKWRSAIWQCTSPPPPGRTIKILSAILVRLGWGRLILMSPLALLYLRIPAHRVTLENKTNLCDLETRIWFELENLLKILLFILRIWNRGKFISIVLNCIII